MLLKPAKDPTSGLYILHTLAGQEEEITNSDISLLLAKSYRDDLSPKQWAELWKLHLRHGHRNFADICRQYNIPMPKEIPACTSCVMGKSHTHPHLSNGFE